MLSEWYKTESMDRPDEWDTNTSPSVVYQRRNISEDTKEAEEGEESMTVYIYEERTMTQAEYAQLQAELESPATKMIMQAMSSLEMNVATMQELMEE